LNDEKDEAQEIVNDISRNADIECVKNFFKLPQNDKMIVSDFKSMILAVAATIKCSDEDKELEFYVDKLITNDDNRRINCLKYYLKELEPASKLVENFEISEDDIEKCKNRLPINGLEKIVEKVELLNGPLSVFTCGAVSGANDYIRFMGKGSFIKYDNISQELKVSEMRKLKEYFKEITLTTANCIIKRFEDNPTAFLANDTLNYFYTKSIKPIDTDEDDIPENHITNLEKVEADTDHECVKEKLNLPENGAKTLLKVEATLIIAASKSKCIKVDTTTFIDDFLNFVVAKHQLSDKKVECASYKLQKIEPTSKLVRTPNNDKDYEKFCEYFHEKISQYATIFYNYENIVGKMNESTCGVFTKQDMDAISFKTMLLANEKDEELKKSEGSALFADIINKLQKLSDCIYERIK
jgi:hypothetical protein